MSVLTAENAVDEEGLPRANNGALPKLCLPVVDPLLFIHANTHSDLEKQRTATENRLRALTNSDPDEDGVFRGYGLGDEHPDVFRMRSLADALLILERDAELTLKRALRRCAIHPWIKSQVGLGEKTAARLLGVIGDPYWHMVEDRPRSVAELWAYSGLHVLSVDHEQPVTHVPLVDGRQAQPASFAPRRVKGRQANWSVEAKSRAYLCSVACMKQARSPYRTVYDQRRARTTETHPEWTAGHSHNDALRVTSKAILRDLWREARRLHGDTDAEVLS